MSWWSDVTDWFSDAWDSVTEWFVDNWQAIVIAIVIIAVVVTAVILWPATVLAVMSTLATGLAAVASWLGPWGVLMLGLGISYLLFPEETVEFVAGIIDVGLDFAADVADAVIPDSVKKVWGATILGLTGYVGYKTYHLFGNTGRRMIKSKTK